MDAEGPLQPTGKPDQDDALARLDAAADEARAETKRTVARFAPNGA